MKKEYGLHFRYRDDRNDLCDERNKMTKITTVHYGAAGTNTHTNNGKTVTTATNHNLIVRHVGSLSDASARKLAEKHAARRGLTVKDIQVVFRP